MTSTLTLKLVSGEQDPSLMQTRSIASRSVAASAATLFAADQSRSGVASLSQAIAPPISTSRPRCFQRIIVRGIEQPWRPKQRSFLLHRLNYVVVNSSILRRSFFSALEDRDHREKEKGSAAKRRLERAKKTKQFLAPFPSPRAQPSFSLSLVPSVS